MYDINRFINEKLSVNFDNEQEMWNFADCCAIEGIGKSPSFWREVRSLSYAVVYNWDERKKILMGPDSHHVINGWRSIKASELLKQKEISRDTLMNFLGE